MVAERPAGAGSIFDTDSKKSNRRTGLESNLKFRARVLREGRRSVFGEGPRDLSSSAFCRFASEDGTPLIFKGRQPREEMKIREGERGATSPGLHALGQRFPDGVTPAHLSGILQLYLALRIYFSSRTKHEANSPPISTITRG